jgi:hypothetical protein
MNVEDEARQRANTIIDEEIAKTEGRSEID